MYAGQDLSSNCPAKVYWLETTTPASTVGYSGVDLTVDHIVPKHSHGPTSWENLVCCCRKCNSKKGGKSSAQSGMHPKTLPRKPRYVPFISLTKFVSATENEEWRDYLPVFTAPDREFARS
jgi:5-methylcytosine-specific restriction endonuclease McrA